MTNRTAIGLRAGIVAWCLGSIVGPASAAEVNIAENLSHVDVMHEGKVVRVERIQDEENVLTGGFAKTSRKCPPFCIHPISVAPGVTTVGELELLDFVKTHVERGTGIMIDARTVEWYAKGTIPGSINIPFVVLQKDENDPAFRSALEKLGAVPQTPGFLEDLWMSLQRLVGVEVNEAAARWNFKGAKELLLWCNGPWCDQSPRAIKGLLKVGYPAKKIRYYRGGMQLWLIHGLTVVVPGAELTP